MKTKGARGIISYNLLCLNEGMITLIKMTQSAVNVLSEAIQNEKRHENEKLYVRMSMGIG